MAVRRFLVPVRWLDQPFEGHHRVVHCHVLAGGVLPWFFHRQRLVGNAGRTAPASIELDTPSDLRSTSNGADLIIITPDGWESSMDN